MFKLTCLAFLVCTLSGAYSFAEGDLCQVSITDLDELKRYLQEERPDSEAPQAKLLGSFTATVGEERITTHHFILPINGEYITASVGYTDESIELVKPGSDTIFDASIELGLYVARKPVESAYGHEGGVSSQADYSKETLWVRVTKIIRHQGKRYAVDLGCFCNGARKRQ